LQWGRLYQTNNILKQSLNDDNTGIDINETNQQNDIPPKVNELTQNNIIEAAAAHTSSRSSLIGTKSIGVDYGLVRTGIAVTVGYEPKPLAILSDLNATELSLQIIKYVELEEASQIIVGLPLHKNGTEAEQTTLTRDFVQHLVVAISAHFGPDDGMPIYLWDERYTSKEAASRARAKNPRANLFKELDADAACIILEHYYNDNGVGAEKVLLPDNENIRSAVEEAWQVRKNEREMKRKRLKEERISSLNAKQMAMERARILDEQLANSRSNPLTKKKKKKKKKKKSGEKKWLTL